MPTFTSYDGTELAYHIAGEGEPLLCLQGGPVDAPAGLGDLGGLAARRQLILLEPTGPAPEGPSDTGDIEALRTHLGLDRIDLLAHAESVRTATLYAAEHPERLRSLTLLAPVDAPADEARAVEVPDVPVPVLVVAGARAAAPGPGRAREVAALFPRGHAVVLEGAGEAPWRDDPGAFVRTVLSFLDPAVHNVRANGVRLAYRTWGDADAPPVVLVHGRGSNSLDWAGIAVELAATRRVIALDLSGHGLSDWPGGYGVVRFRDDLRGFLTALGLDSVDVVAHSMGGFAAYLLAQEAPELFGLLVLEESPALFPLDPQRPPAVRPEGELGFDWPVVPALDAQLNAPDPLWREGLDRIEAPTLVVAGGPRSHIPQERFAWMAGRIPDSRLTTIDAGHLVHAERPAEFLAALREFGI